MNSIKTNLTKDDIISEIRLCLGADIKREYTFVLVEGEDDIKFCKKNLSKKVTLFASFSGKEGIKEIIQEHFNTNPRVIGIKDQDYEIAPEQGNIFCYDYCCMEMMLVKNEYAFNSIYEEFYSGELSSNELRYVLLKQLKYISFIRKNNEVQHLNLKINGISLSNAFDQLTKNIDNSTIISKLNDMNEHFFEINEDKLSQINAQYNTELDLEELLSITQGHDFITLFNIFCKRKRGSNVNDKTISSGLRCAYRKIDFMSTLLCSKLREHEDKYNLRIV